MQDRGEVIELEILLRLPFMLNRVQGTGRSPARERRQFLEGEENDTKEWFFERAKQGELHRVRQETPSERRNILQAMYEQDFRPWESVKADKELTTHRV